MPTVEPGLPSALLVRRPDIVQTEAALRIARADVDLARLAYLPNISLTGSASLVSDSDRLVSGNTSAIQLLLDNGARRRNVGRQRLQLESALADLSRAEDAFRIAEARYREGVDDYQTVLITQNALFAARTLLLDNKLAQLNAVIALYQSLGGGWVAKAS